MLSYFKSKVILMKSVQSDIHTVKHPTEDVGSLGTDQSDQWKCWSYM